MASSDKKPILIAGGGIAALLFARSLLKSGLPFILFERDASIVFRAQGYRLRLSNEGLDAIEEVLQDDFKSFWDATGKTGGDKGFAALDAISGEELDSKETDADKKAKEEKKAALPQSITREPLTSREGKTIGISRGDMRAIFLEGCEPYIRWSHHVTGYEVTTEGVRIIFADGSKSEEGSLLVGAEGIHSKIAKQVSGGKIKTFDTMARGIHGQAPSTAFKELGEGVWRLVDTSEPGKRVFIITNVRPGDKDDPEATLGWTLGATPGVIEPPNNDFSIIGKQAADIAKSLTANWHPRFKPLFDNMVESEAAFWKITCSSPSGVPQWPNEPRVTVIGDAVHSMTPAGGIGANTAVRDSALLGRLLRENGGWAEGVTAAYEEKMRVYGSEAVATSYSFATEGFGVKIDENNSPLVKV